MTDRTVVRTVVWFIGLAVLMFGFLTVWLASRVLDQSSGAGTVDAAAVAVVAIPAGFTTTALGFLGGLLVSTRTTPDKGEIEEALAPLGGSGGAGLAVTGVGGGPVVTVDPATLSAAHAAGEHDDEYVDGCPECAAEADA